MLHTYGLWVLGGSVLVSGMLALAVTFSDAESKKSEPGLGFVFFLVTIFCTALFGAMLEENEYTSVAIASCPKDKVLLERHFVCQTSISARIVFKDGVPQPFEYKHAP